MSNELKTINGIEIDANVLACLKAIVTMVTYCFDNPVPTAKGKSVAELRMFRCTVKGFLGMPNGAFPLGILTSEYNPLTISKAVHVGDGKLFKAVVTNRGGTDIVTPKDLAVAIQERLGTYSETSPYARMKFWLYDMRDERKAKGKSNTAALSIAPDWLTTKEDVTDDILELLVNKD